MFKTCNRSSSKVKIPLTFKGIYLKPKEMISLCVSFTISQFLSVKLLLKSCCHIQAFTLNVKQLVFFFLKT